MEQKGNHIVPMLYVQIPCIVFIISYSQKQNNLAEHIIYALRDMCLSGVGFRFSKKSVRRHAQMDLDNIISICRETGNGLGGRAELVSKLSSDVIEGYKAGLLTREQAIAELKSRGEELGVYGKIQAG